MLSIALPVGANALLGNLMGAANATLIPQKLVEGGMERSAAISEFGVVCGMTMPMLSLPIVFLGSPQSGPGPPSGSGLRLKLAG